jgi:hypothetical protein
VIEALVLGKVIMVGGMFQLGHRFEDQPLIYPTLYKTFVFAAFVGIFKLLEHLIRNLWTGEPIAHDVAIDGLHVMLANCLVVLVAFLPFFGIKELGRVLGTGKIVSLFFRNGSAGNAAA